MLLDPGDADADSGGEGGSGDSPEVSPGCGCGGPNGCVVLCGLMCLWLTIVKSVTDSEWVYVGGLECA